MPSLLPSTGRLSFGATDWRHDRKRKQTERREERVSKQAGQPEANKQTSKQANKHTTQRHHQIDTIWGLRFLRVLFLGLAQRQAEGTGSLILTHAGLAQRKNPLDFFLSPEISWCARFFLVRKKREKTTKTHPRFRPLKRASPPPPQRDRRTKPRRTAAPTSARAGASGRPWAAGTGC